jgi:hypothetical protein
VSAERERKRPVNPTVYPGVAASRAGPAAVVGHDPPASPAALQPTSERNAMRVLLTVLVSVFVLAPVSPALAQGKRTSGQTASGESTFFSTVQLEPASSVDPFSNGDLWPAAWSDDGRLYLANGDGWGFGPTSPWADLVVNALDGHPNDGGLKGVRLAAGAGVGSVWSDPERYNRKPTGMVSVDGVLYLAVQDLNRSGAGSFNDAPAATILRSDDKGRSWNWDRQSPMFDDYVFTTIMFLDYGRDGVDNTFDEYLYAYGLDHNWRDSFSDTVPDPTELFLARVPKDGVQDRSRWEFYTGDLAGRASWSAPGDIDARQPVLVDERRLYTDTLYPVQPSDLSVLSQGSVVYNRPLDRYIYTSWTEYTFEFYEAPAPWGPWRRFLSHDFGLYPWSQNSFGGYGTVIPSKFIAEDGREMWVGSSTFMGGVQRYNFSLRRLLVTPYRFTIPANLPGPDNLALPEHARDPTPISRVSPRSGYLDGLRDGVRDTAEDSWSGERKAEDYWGYTWSRAYNLNTLVYTNGFVDEGGGWFEDLTVQVRQGFEWVDVMGLSITPEYEGGVDLAEFATFTITFDETWGDGVRIKGGPGGTGSFTSISELEVYYRAERGPAGPR